MKNQCYLMAFYYLLPFLFPAVLPAMRTFAIPVKRSTSSGLWSRTRLHLRTHLLGAGECLVDLLLMICVKDRSSTRCRINEHKLFPLPEIISHDHHNHLLAIHLKLSLESLLQWEFMILGLKLKQSCMKITERDSWQLFKTTQDASLLSTCI